MDTIRLRHALEQFGAGLQELAPLLAQYQKKLVAEGFSVAAAFVLVRDMQAQIVNLSKKEEQ